MVRGCVGCQKESEAVGVSTVARVFGVTDAACVDIDISCDRKTMFRGRDRDGVYRNQASLLGRVRRRLLKDYQERISQS
jgi:hypothetical protein